MKKFEILRKLQKYDTETESEQMLLKKMAHRLAQSSCHKLNGCKKCNICEAQ